MSRYDPYEIARLKMEEVKDERDIDMQTWVGAEKIAEAYEELEEKIEQIALGVAEAVGETLKDAVDWQMSGITTVEEGEQYDAIRDKVLIATMKHLKELIIN
jgi:hypothetical protein